MNEELDIIVSGFDVSDRQAEAGLSRVFGLDSKRAHRFVRELPIVAKRCPNQASAERYAHALRSIGARVELRAVATLSPTDATALGPSHSSLPIPAPSVMAQLHESMRVERETRRAIRLFRAAEGLDREDTGAPLAEVDSINPAIPKAPLLPRDLHELPNAALPAYSERPQARNPYADDADQAASVRSPRPHADARLPPPLAGDPPSRGPGAESVRRRDVGLAHAATASVRPGLGARSATHAQRRTRQALKSRRLRWAGAILLLLLAGVGVWLSGLLDSADDRRKRAWAEHGIEAGEHAEARAWLENREHGLTGLDPNVARQLVDRLERAGALGVYAVRFRSTPNGRSASALVVELPHGAAARRIILWHSAKARGLDSPLIPDRGERYHLLTWR